MAKSHFIGIISAEELEKQANTINKYKNMCYYIVIGKYKMKSYSSREVIKMLKEDAWYKSPKAGTGHLQFKHLTEKG